MDGEKETAMTSPDLMSPNDTALLLIDMQEKLAPAIDGASRIAWNARRLLDAAKIEGLPVLATEQYPDGLGPTLPELAERLESPPLPKMMFSCSECADALKGLVDQGRFKILVTGVETHVCVAQTVFDLLSSGWRVYVAVDAVGSRASLDHETALRRMDSAGAVLTTTEAAIFEWRRTADDAKFKAIRKLVMERPPV